MAKAESFRQWMKIYDDEVIKSFQDERKELQKVSMLVTALHKEIKRVQRFCDEKFSSLGKQLKHIDILETKAKSRPAIDEDIPNLTTTSGIESSKSVQLSDCDSPDIFRNESIDFLNKNSPSSEISAIEEDIINSEKSPSLLSKRRKIRKSAEKCKDISKNIFHRGNKENSVIVDNTPEIKNINPVKICNAGKSVKKKRKKTTLTQMFSDISKIDCTCSKESKCEDKLKVNDTTKCDYKQLAVNDTTYLNQSDINFFQDIIGKRQKETFTLNKTYSEKSGKRHSSNNESLTQNENNEELGELGITKLLDIINQVEEEEGKNNENDEEMDSMQELDEFSKGIIFDEESPVAKSPKKIVKAEVHVEPVVRGKARKLLNGFSCAECRDFYAAMNLSSQELRKRMNECSKHRYVYKPPEDTFPAIWDLSIPDEKETEKRTLP